MIFPTRESLIDQYARQTFFPSYMNWARSKFGEDAGRLKANDPRIINPFKNLVLTGSGQNLGSVYYQEAQKFENYYGGLIQQELTRQEQLYAQEIAQQQKLIQEALAKSSAEVAAAQKAFTESQATARTQIEATEAERVRTLAEIETSRAKAEAKIQQATETAEAMSKRYAAAASAQTQATKSGSIRTQIGSPEQLRTQPKSTKTPVGQPRVARTRLTVGTGVGGYGGTSAGQITPTGLNI